jgi:hypothetical protein
LTRTSPARVIGRIGERVDTRLERVEDCSVVSDLSGWGDKITYDSAGAGVSAAAPLDLAHLLEMEAGVPAIAWVSDRGVEVRFLRPAELAGAADRTLVSEPGTGKSSAQIAGGVVGFGVAWQEGAAGHAVIKLRGLPTDEAPLGAEITVGRIGYSNHSPSIAACRIPALDSAGAFGIDVAWVESAQGDTSGFGRILLRNSASRTTMPVRTMLRALPSARPASFWSPPTTTSPRSLPSAASR